MYVCLTVRVYVCRDCLATVCVNSCTSLFSGFVIFSYLGHMSARDHKNINDVAADGMIHNYSLFQQRTSLSWLSTAYPTQPRLCAPLPVPAIGTILTISTVDRTELKVIA